MFDGYYYFYGKHAKMVKEFVGKFDADLNFNMFSRNIDVYKVAPLIGFLFDKRSKPDKSGENTSIFAEQIINERSDFIFNLKLIVFNYKKKEFSLKERIERIKEIDNHQNINEFLELYDEFVLGGLEFLYQMLIEDSNHDINNILNNISLLLNKVGELEHVE